MSRAPTPDPGSAEQLAEARSAELHRLRRQLRQLERQLDAREEELAVLLGSNSFKLTAPLRWLRRCISRVGRVGMQSDVQVASKQGLPPAIRAFPRRLIELEPTSDPNRSHRPLRLDGAIQPLVPVRVCNGRLEDSSDPRAARYHGRQIDPLRVATIASRELREELSFDVAVFPLQAEGWGEQLHAGQVRMVLIEGAWEPEGGWGAGFVGSPASQHRLQSLLDHCRVCAIPVVLWAREDAGGLDRLAWLLPRVDRVYAVDCDGLQWMRRNFPDVDCALLPVAIQPALYNPVRSYGIKDCQAALEGSVLFDGWWAASSGESFDPAVAAAGDRLRVVETDGDYSWTRLGDSARLADVSLGSLTPLEKSALLRNGGVELFIPHALFRPWRQCNSMLRAAASGAMVLWAGGGAPPWAGSEHTEASRLRERLDTSKSTAWDGARARHLAIRELLSWHCVADRLAVIVHELGLGDGLLPGRPQVAHLLVTMRPELLERCLNRFRADQYPHRELVVVLHGDDVNMAAARTLVQDGEPVTLLKASSNRSLGDCLNMAVAHTGAPIWMKIDDDDHYGPAYTGDMMLYRRAIDAPMMGKPPAFVHLKRGDELRWSPIWASHANLLHDAQEATAALVAGGTLAGKREVLESIRFSSGRRGGSDSDFIQRCFERGYDLLATDGFNFARYRDDQGGSHTWKVSDEELRMGTVHLGTGAKLSTHVFV